MKWINTLLFVCCIHSLIAQQDNTEEKRWFSFDFFVPDVAYSFQRIRQANFPDQSGPLRLENKLHLIDFEIVKARVSFFDQFSFGVQIMYSTVSKKKNAQAEYENSMPEKHLTNWKTEKMYHFTPQIFVGYRYSYKQTEQKTHAIGCTVYLNFDRFNYGNYSYDVKNVNDNHFYHYNFQTTTSKSKSVTFEIDHSTKYHHTKFSEANPNTKLRPGIRAGFTLGSQGIQFTETFQSLDNTTTNNLTPLHFKTWSFHLGLYLSLETSR